MNYLDLDLHQYRDQLIIKDKDSKKWLWCPIRKIHLVPQPEELVRQLLILYLVHEKEVPLSRIQAEKSVKVNGQARRFDLLIYSKNMEPLVIIECKAHTEALTQQVIDQAGAYNTAIQAPYLLVTNGVKTIIFQTNIEEKESLPLPDIPKYKEM